MKQDYLEKNCGCGYATGSCWTPTIYGKEACRESCSVSREGLFSIFSSTRIIGEQWIRKVLLGSEIKTYSRNILPPHSRNPLQSFAQ
jgi:hypothetical protein